MPTTSAVISQIIGVALAGEDDPRIQTFVQDYLDDFRLDALRVEASAEARLVDEVERIRQHYCMPVESIDFHYRLLACDPSTVSSSTYIVGSRPPQPLELKFHQPAAVSATMDTVAVTTAAATAAVDTDTTADINGPVAPDDAAPDPPTAMSTDDGDAVDLPPAPLQRSQSLQQEFACCICLNLMYEPTSLACGHSGCLACMKQAVRTKAECPICKARVHHELTVTIALRTAMKRLCPEYGPPIDTQTAPTVAPTLAGGVDLRGTLEVVCSHLGLQYHESHGTVTFILASPPDVERSFRHANLPFRRLLEDSRLRHPVYAEGILEQHAHLYAQMVAGEHEPCHPITNIPTSILDTLVRPLLMKAGPYREWINAEHERFQSAVATRVGVAWTPFQSSITSDDWLPRRLLRKLCRRAGCPMESSSVYVELRSVLKKFLKMLLTIAHELQKHRRETIITCDTLLRSLPRLYSGHRSELRVFGYGVAGNIRHILGAQLKTVLLQVHVALMLDEVAMSVLHDLVVTAMLEVARFAMTQSQQRGHLYATLTCTTEVDPTCRPWEFSVYEANAAGADDVVTVTTMDDVLLAIRTMIPTELARHAIRECTQAVTKYHQRNATNQVPVPGMEMRQWAGLVFAPESIALIVDTHFGVEKIHLTIDALISLTTLSEYLSAELIELSGNAAKDMDQKVIAPSHVSMAILADDELRRLYPGMIRYGGHVPPPSFRPFMFIHVEPDPTWMPTLENHVASVVVSTGAVTPHLLWGRYVGPNDHVVSQTEPQYMWMPVMDCLAYPKLGEAKRQLMALEAAPLDIQQLVERMGTDAASTWRRRLLELTQEQRQRPMYPLFTHETMFALASHVMNDRETTVVLTSEAIDLLATVSESFMIRSVSEAYLAGTQAKRFVLEVYDFHFVRHFRGERG